jgi:hypothetical protein
MLWSVRAAPKRLTRCEPFRQPGERPPRRQPIPCAEALQPIANGGFDRPARDGIQVFAQARQPQNGPPVVSGIADTHEQTLRDETLKHSGERARVHVKNRGEIARRESGEQADDAQHEPLRTCHADVGDHPLGGPFEAVDHRPEKLHELQDVGQLELAFCERSACNRDLFGHQSTLIIRCGHFSMAAAKARAKVAGENLGR